MTPEERTALLKRNQLLQVNAQLEKYAKAAVEVEKLKL